MRGLNYWNVDLSVKKMFKITERFSTEFQVVFTNLFNHDQFGDPDGEFSTPATLLAGVSAGNRNHGSSLACRWSSVFASASNLWKQSSPPPGAQAPGVFCALPKKRESAVHLVG